ncbi:hypothetical protein V6Z12_A12G196900 [Gossypium hirsutum]
MNFPFFYGRSAVCSVHCLLIVTAYSQDCIYICCWRTLAFLVAVFTFKWS